MNTCFTSFVSIPVSQHFMKIQYGVQQAAH